LGSRRNILDDEQLLARPDEAELAARDLLDRRRILAQPASLLAEACILGVLTNDRERELVVLFSRPHHRQQAAVADHRVDDDDRGDEDQQEVDDPAGCARGPGRGHPAFLPRSDVVLRHG